MSALDPVVDAYLDGATISGALLVFMDFVDAPKRWWPDFGTLQAGGHEWQGTGTFISVSGLESGANMSAPGTTFTLSGLDPEVTVLVASASDRVKDRRVQVFIQFFRVEGDAVLGTLGDPVAIWSGLMDTMRFSGTPETSQVTLTAESLWAGRRRPAYGLYSYKDQQARHPGDRSLRYMQSLTKKTIKGFPP